MLHKILSTCAVNTKTGKTFYEECRVYKKDKSDPKALAVDGFTEAQARDLKR